jgi:hypothetical protein
MSPEIATSKSPNQPVALFTSSIFSLVHAIKTSQYFAFFNFLNNSSEQNDFVVFAKVQ